jgi:cell division protein FtsQ
MQQVWRRRWSNTGWLALAALTLVLLGAGVHKKNHKVCQGIEVKFNGDGNNFFIDQKGVASVLKANGGIKGLPIDQINLRQLEDRLKKDRWIEDAQLFFDNKQVLQVLIEEKEPVARIFTAAGSSYYIDSSCRRLPLSDKLSARIPMFTNFPSDRLTLSRPDSELLASVKELAMFIQADELWKAQVAQIDITPKGFEMIPTVGSHVVALGKGGDYQQKFDRLFSFYKQVWTKVGFERYEKIDVQFNGQVVATIKGKKSMIQIDSAKAEAAFENLLSTAKKLTGDSANAEPVTHAVATKAVVNDTASKVTKAVVNKVIATLKEDKKKTLVKAAAKKTPVKKNNAEQSLTADEEAIRKEAIKQQLKQQQALKKQDVQKKPVVTKAQLKTNVPVKKAPKAVLKNGH